MIEALVEISKELKLIEEYLTKGSGKYKILANKLSNLLIDIYNREEKEAIDDAIRYLTSDKEITRDDLVAVFKDVELRLGSRLYELFRKDINNFQVKTYNYGHKDVGLKLEFNKTDVKCLKWLDQEINQFWMGDDYSDKLNADLRDLQSQIIKEGLGPTDSGERIRAHFAEKEKRSQSYYTLLANHTITRTREFSKVSAYEKAGIEYVIIDAIDDEKTTLICRTLDGKLIPVSHLAEQRNSLMKANSVEKIKELSPWWSKKKDIIAKVVGKSSKQLPKSIGLPPYHGGCRTQTVAAFNEDVEKDEFYNKVLEDKEVRKNIREYVKSGTSDFTANLKVNTTDAGLIYFYSKGNKKVRAFDQALKSGIKNNFHESLEFCLNNALDKLPNFEGAVYKNFQFDNDFQKQIFLSQFEVNTIVNFNSFLKANRKNNGMLSSGIVQLVINSKTGKDVGCFPTSNSADDIKNKFEILFNSNIDFIVKALESKEGATQIVLAEKSNRS